MVTLDRGAAFGLEVRGPETRYSLIVISYKLLIKRMVELKDTGINK